VRFYLRVLFCFISFTSVVCLNLAVNILKGILYTRIPATYSEMQLWRANSLSEATEPLVASDRLLALRNCISEHVAGVQVYKMSFKMLTARFRQTTIRSMALNASSLMCCCNCSSSQLPAIHENDVSSGVFRCWPDCLELTARKTHWSGVMRWQLHRTVAEDVVIFAVPVYSAR